MNDPVGDVEEDFPANSDDPKMVETEKASQFLEIVGEIGRREKLDQLQERLMPTERFSANMRRRTGAPEADGLTLKFGGDFFALPEKQRRIFVRDGGFER